MSMTNPERVLKTILRVTALYVILLCLLFLCLLSGCAGLNVSWVATASYNTGTATTTSVLTPGFPVPKQ